MPEQSLVIEFDYASPDTGPLRSLCRDIEAALARTGAGSFDGHDLGPDGAAMLMLYGPDARALLQAVRPLIESAAFVRGAEARLRFGPLSASSVREERVRIGG